jgi:hypothetical protein
VLYPSELRGLAATILNRGKILGERPAAVQQDVDRVIHGDPHSVLRVLPRTTSGTGPRRAVTAARDPAWPSENEIVRWRSGSECPRVQSAGPAWGTRPTAWLISGRSDRVKRP